MKVMNQNKNKTIKRKYRYILISSLMACILLYYVEQVLQVTYPIKTLIKIILFTVIPIIYIRFYKRSNFQMALDHKILYRKNLELGFLLGLMSFSVILLAYFIFKDFIDLEGIVQDMQSKSITPVNFIFIALYITFVNSFLEEFFFRGFIFLNLYELKFKKAAYIYSSLLFALYHIAIFKSWFNLWLTALALTGLLVISFIFNFIDTKSRNFINSWIVHILADISIVLIGMRMLKLF